MTKFISVKWVTVLSTFIATASLAPIPAAQVANPPLVVVSNAVHYDLSPPLSSIPPIIPVNGPPDADQRLRLPVLPGTIGSPDPKVQTFASLSFLAPAPSTGFQGIGIPNYTVNSVPPDTNGTVGPNHYVQWVNSAFAIFNKTTGARLMGPSAGNTLWLGFGGNCETDNDGDPIVLYDRIAGRWLFSQFANVHNGPPFFQCIAVSQTSDPTGAYYRYSFSYAPNLNDYTKFGVWPDAYYSTQNMFSSLGFFQGAKVCAFDRARMLAGLSATQQCFNTSPTEGGLLPSDLDGSTLPPSGAPNYLLNFGANSLNLWKFHVDWANPGNSTFSGPTNIPVAPFSIACGGGNCIPQLGTTQQLDSLSDRLMYRLAYRNFGTHESLVTNHSVTAGSSVGVRWYELRSPGTSPSVFQQSTYAPDSSSRWMGSIAMDQAGDIALGYSISSSSTNPSIRFTGRLPSDPLDTMQAESIALTGTGSQGPYPPNPGAGARWGDYSSMSVDPTDDCTFWYTNQYLSTNGTFNWSTWITSFKFPNCGVTTPPAPPTNLTAVAGDHVVNLSWTASTGATSYTVSRSTVSGGPYTALASPTGTTYADTTANNGTTYYYVVQAANAAGPSGYSTEASATPAPSVSGVIAFDASSGLQQSATNASSLTYAFTVGSGLSKSMLLVFVPGYADTTVSVSSITYAGVPLARIRRDNNGIHGAYSEVWSLLAPASGANNVVITISGPVGSGNAIYSGAMSFSGVDQANPIDAQTGSIVTGSHGSHSDTITTVANNAWLVDGLASQNTATAGMGQTQRWSGGAALLERSGGSYRGPISPPGPTAMSWSWATSGGASAHSVVSLKPAGPTTPPAAPTNLSATAGDRQVSLSWTASVGATSYKVFRSQTSGGPYTTPIATPGGTTYTDTGLIVGTTYYYVVQAVNASGTSGNSNEASATPFCGTPAAPATLTATPGPGQVALNWAGVSGAASYNVKRSTTSGGPYAAIASGVTTTTYTDTTVTSGTTYYYVVTAVNACGAESGTSPQASAVVPPAPPTNLTATGGDRQVGLSWTGSAGATSYKVFRSQTSGGPYTTPIATPSGTTYTDTGLNAGTTYYYVVQAVNAGGSSGNSTEASATPFCGVPAAPATLTATPGPGQVALNWGAVSGAASYTVKRSTTSGGGYTTVTSGVTTTTYTDTTVISGTTYYYVVTAVNSCGAESGTSPEASATPTPPSAAIAFDASSGLQQSATNASSLTYAFTVGSGLSKSMLLVFVPGYADPTVSVSSITYAGVPLARIRRDANGIHGAYSEVWSLLAPASGANNVVITISGPVGSGNVIYSGAMSFSGVDQASPIDAQTGSIVTGSHGSHSDTMTTVANNAWLVDGLASQNAATAGTGQTQAWSGGAAFLERSGGSYRGPISPPGPTAISWSWATSGGASAHSVVSLKPAGPTTPPAAPTNLSATAGDRQVSLSWTASVGATSYNVFRSQTSGGPYTTPIASPTGTTYTDTGLVVGTTYYYVVQAVNSAGSSGNSTEASATPFCGVPAAPATLTATPGPGQVALNWGAVSGAASYTVKRSTTSGGGYTTVTSGVTTTSYTDTTVTPGTTYYYVVTAVNACGAESGNSPQASAVVPPAPPTNLSATAGDRQVGLSWTASAGATSYTVLRSTTSGGPYTTVASPTGTTYTDTGLTAGTTYYYVVRAVNAGGSSGNSTEASATPFCGVPAAPATLTATPGPGQVSLNWGAVSGAASYTVKRSTTSGGGYTTITSGVTTTSYTDTTVISGTTYYYVVTAVNSCGAESGNSPQASATPLPPSGPGIAFDASSGLQQSATNASSLTYAFTVGSGLSKSILLVFVPGYADPAVSVSSITYAGVPLAKIRRDNNGIHGAYSEVWYLLAPASGANNVVITISGPVGSGNAIYSGAMSFSGVDQANPIDAQTGSIVTGSHGSHSDTITTVANNAWIVDGMASQNAATAGTGQTQAWSGGAAFLERSGGSYRGPISPPGPTAISWSWATSGGASAHSVVSLKPF